MKNIYIFTIALFAFEERKFRQKILKRIYYFRNFSFNYNTLKWLKITKKVVKICNQLISVSSFIESKIILFTIF
jgi:hypothetical protein